MDDSKELLLKKIQRLELEKQQLVQLLHDTEQTMAQQFKKSQEETAHLKQLFTSVLPLIKAKSSASTKDQSVTTETNVCLAKGTQTTMVNSDSQGGDQRLVMVTLAALEQKLAEIEVCAIESKASADTSDELLKAKQREIALQETATNCKKQADQLQSENERYVSELKTLQKENEMLRLYVMDSEGQDRPIPAVCKALYSRR